ncbi:expressed protein [Phakopsora pachyrhizi]|uniref:Expressed protein n=1 Tax=Phakopsora pachyrhizi TaxID=170000 RepID=A0AAV0BHG6_PHAPC|nr:expressed protein [Phakopsora pachyrhizi]
MAQHCENCEKWIQTSSTMHSANHLPKKLAAILEKPTVQKPPDVVYPGENINDQNGGPNALVPPLYSTSPTVTSLPKPLGDQAIISTSALSAIPSSTESVSFASIATTFPPSPPQSSSTSAPITEGSQSQSKISKKNSLSTFLALLIVLLILSAMAGYGVFRLRKRKKRRKREVEAHIKFKEFKTVNEISAPIPTPYLNQETSQLSSQKNLVEDRVPVEIPKNSSKLRKKVNFNLDDEKNSLRNNYLTEVNQSPRNTTNIKSRNLRDSDFYSNISDYYDGEKTETSEYSSRPRRLQSIPFKIPLPSKVDPTRNR